MDFITENVLHTHILYVDSKNNEQLSLACVCQYSHHTQQEENQMHMLCLTLAVLGCVKNLPLAEYPCFL